MNCWKNSSLEIKAKVGGKRLYDKMDFRVEKILPEIKLLVKS